ncbi:PREDICTED: cytosolic 5'-nucleotidase 1B-like [Buceros rhinoceros silvestris]|uniref:cytosolic 5'-nucleotidase 1B-like n=1 Tax=Buceros rhinoceros silvestris TaxID=175836 RepID=UPI0005288923|nr:PREDICTED: cytosolic 5'-nucleotidase 1B-like [Buceros rhinoceros silvestris]
MAEPESTVVNTDVKQKDPNEALVIAVTTRAIFSLEEEHKLYLEKGKEEYIRHQQANQDKPLPPGTAFAFIQAVQYVNKKILENNPAEKDLFDILVLCNNSPESGIRIVNSAKHYGLEISKFCFVSDEDSTQYLKSHGVKLFLSADRTDVCNALRRGAVPMGEGPLKAFAMHLGKIHKKFSQENSPIRTYLVTARSGRDMGVRALKTLREWGLPIDEAFFMDGAPKGPILAQIQPHIFFDDGLHNIQGAQNVGVPSAWVPSCC